MKALRQTFNVLLNVFWTAIFMGPVSVFCIRALPAKVLALFLFAVILPFFIHRSVLQRMQLSADKRVYRRLGIPLLVKFTQDAPWIHNLGGSFDKHMSRNREAIARFKRDTWMRERFHLGLFLFCALCAGVALWRRQFLWFIVLLLMNTLYNLYPVWLQQYLRLRAPRLLGRDANRTEYRT